MERVQAVTSFPRGTARPCSRPMRAIRGVRRVRVLACGAALLAVTALTVAGCGGEGGGGDEPGAGAGSHRASQTSPASPEAGVRLATYRGQGFTVGYPEGWTKVPGHTVVPKAAFEVGVSSRDGTTMQSSFDVLVNEDLPFPLARITDDFVAFSRASDAFRLLGRQRIELDGAEGWEVRKAYRSPEGLDLRQVDLFTKTPQGRVVDIRMIFTASRYEASQGLVSSVRSSFRFV
ncbi:hypothetical protein Acsp03_63910 [Actinomadura sp. NBRC 104412]|uniref:hypothetical protein n=1 Tax=Actinomadura sp. NBRC 104412 TaxID=3032203 RepID=UPI0024A041BB|nr:hypothetical protein [Actinomadura sp. NBRC 104412]GLZ08925.1 hypothetical protein Acsp03_63910 [Actinomadura sp. NBRC 104412]